MLMVAATVSFVKRAAAICVGLVVYEWYNSRAETDYLLRLRMYCGTDAAQKKGAVKSFTAPFGFLKVYHVACIAYPLRTGDRQGIYTPASAVSPLQPLYPAAFEHVRDWHSLTT